MTHLGGFKPSLTRIAVIGAGAAGLCTARVFSHSGYNVTIFEASGHIGGTWVYSPKPSPTSSLYESLRCNLPKQAMAFADHPFSANAPTFPSHREVLQYLESYADRFQLRRYCRFNQSVTSVRKLHENNKSEWEVTTNTGFRGRFHAIMVCNGHFSKAHYSEIPGAEAFIASGRNIIHSYEYKNPFRFDNRRILIVGSGPSGIDISIEVSKHAAITYISHRKKRGSVFSVEREPLPHEVAPVSHVTGSGDVHLVDGSILPAIDDILLCTGYEYSFPFLEDGVAGVYVSPDGRSVHGLVSHCVAAKDPTIAFIGLPWSVIPFPLFEDQAYFLATLHSTDADHAKFASLFEEQKRESETIEQRGKYYHRLGDQQWEYRRRLAGLAGRDTVGPSLIELLRHVSAARKRDPTRFRDLDYYLLGPDPGQWRVTEHGVDITGRDDPGSPTNPVS